MFGIDFSSPQKDGKLKLMYLRPLDLSVDETVHEIVAAVKEIGCKRLLIDSLVGFEMALARLRALTSVVPELWSTVSGQNEPELRAVAPPSTKKESLPRTRKRGKRGRKKQ